MKDFKNKTVVITGAGSGIGRALAVQFSDLGANLSLNDFNEATLIETKNIIAKNNPNAKVYTEVFDVSKIEDYTRFSENTINEFKSVDVVINNAGVAISKAKLVDIPFEDIFWLLDINLKAMIIGSKLFIPHLMKQKEASLVNISSVFGLVGVPDQSPYVTSKFAVRGLNEALYSELKSTSVCVSSVHPGGIKTNIGKNSKRIYKTQKEEELLKFFEEKLLITTAADAAKTIIKGIKNKKRKILVGKDAVIMNFLSIIAPSFVRFLNINAPKWAGFE